jgi:hypothetical protein
MIRSKAVSGIVAVALTVAGCAAPNSGGGGTAQSNNDDTAVRCALLGVGGAIFGAKLGGKNGALKGAALGLATCAVIEVATRRTKTAAEVEQQYRVANHNQLPPEAKIDALSTVVSPNGVVKAGDAIKIESTVRAVSGSTQPVWEVKEVLIAYAPDGQEFKRGEKQLNDVNGSGEYVNSFTLRLPAAAPQGTYRIETIVVLNGRPMIKRDTSMQVAFAGKSPAYAMLDR